MLDEIVIEPGAYYVMDRGYLDFFRLHRIHLAGAFFVTRARSDQRVRRVYSRPATSPAASWRINSSAWRSSERHRDYPFSFAAASVLRSGNRQSASSSLPTSSRFPARTIMCPLQSRWRVSFFQMDQAALAHQAFYGNH